MKKSSTSKSQSKTEIALKESEQRYRTTMMSVGDGVIATDTEGRVEMMNPVAEELTGWKSEKARGKSLEEIFHIINEETRQTVENPVRRVMREGIVVGLANHSVLIARDGTERPIADSGAPIRNEKNDITGVVLVFRDQTQERTAQKALQESERKFRETVKNLDEGYYSCMMDGIVLGHNEAFNRILGIDISKDMKGSKLPDFWLNPDDRKVYLLELMTNGFIRNFLINAKTIGGEKVVVLVNSHLVKDEQGKPVRIEGTFTDFTRMKLMEEDLKESEAKYKTLFENAQVGIYRTKLDGSAFLDVNDEFARIIGFSRQELIGSPGRIRWANPENRDKMLKQLLEQSGVLTNYDAQVLTKNGEARDVLASIQLYPDEGYLEGTMIDITERKRAESKIRKLNRMYMVLSEVNQAVVRIHELKELFEKVCHISVEQGGFGMAWIGLIDESSQKIQVIAKAGKTGNYLEKLDISFNGEPLSYCPINSVLRRGQHKVCNVIESKEMAPCQKIAFDLGFRSSASLPLKVSDILKGTITFYSDEPEFFNEEELKLLDEMASDISFAMEFAEKETIRCQAEKALQESERKFRETVKYLDEGFYSVTVDGLLLDHNQAFNRILGFDIAKDMKGAKLPDFWQNTDDRKVYLKELMASGSIMNYLINAKKSDGEKIIVLANAHLVKDENDKLLRIEGTFTDFTGLKRAEEALASSEQFLSNVIEQSPVSLWISDSEGTLMRMNQACRELFGITDKEAVGKYNLLKDNLIEAQGFMALVGDVFEKGEIARFTIDYDVRRVEHIEVKGATHRILDVVISPIKDIHGKLTNVVVQHKDITDRKRAEEALLASEVRSRSYIEATGHIGWVTNADGEIVEDVPSLRKFNGQTYEEAKGSGWAKTLHPDDLERSLQVWNKAVVTKSFYEIEYRMRRHDGVYRHMMARGFPVFREDGSILEWIGACIDITESKLAEEQLRKLNRIYSLLSDINQAIVRSRVPEELFEKVCEIAVEQGGFGMAWIGLLDESFQKLQVTARAGKFDDYFEKIDISLNNKPLSYCPIDSALRHGKHSICKIIENKEMATCQKIAFDLGFRSSASFPLKVSDILKGALTFYSDEPEFFDEAELKLLDELALDISFAMEYAEKEAERKQVEEALRESEVRFRIAAETSNDVVYEWDLKQEVKWFGKIDEMLGYDPGEFPRTLEGLGASVHPEDWVRVMAAVQAHLDGRTPYAEDYRVLMKDGTFRWWSARGAVARMPDGKPVRWVGTVTDITERKLAEEALKISKERLLFATEGANLGIWNWNIVTGELIWSDQCKALFGVPPDETMSYQRFSDALHPDDRERTDEAVKDTIDNHKDFDIEYRSLWPDESIHWLAAKGRGFYDATGKAVRLEGIVLDITERKRTEESLSIQKRIGDIFLTVPDDEMFYEVLKVILDLMQSPFGVFGYLDEAGALVVPTMTRQIWDKCQVPEKTFTFPRDTWGNSSWPRAIREKKTNYSNEVSTRTPEGHITLTRHISLPILFQGEVIGLFQVANKETNYTDVDINTLEAIAGYVASVLHARLQRQLSEKEILKLNAELEERVAKRTAQLESSNKELEAFSYSVSHDLRAPLRHVSGYVELLNKRFQSTLSEKGLHYLNSIADSVRHMGVLIDDLLQFSRTGRMEMLKAILDMNEIVQEVKESISKENPDRKIVWVLGKLASVYGDEAMLRLVWMNLLSNAVKFTRTRRKARIEIGVRKENKELVFFVRDNGVGFDMQYAQKLFGVFQRLHPTEEFEGTGIGLANVHRIVLRHGGRTWAEAEPDKGAVFYFSIPKK